MLSEIKKHIFSAMPLKLSELNKSETVLVVVDMINGFVNEGSLSSPRIRNIVSDVSKLVSECREKDIDIIAFADCHKENSVEFENFPVHCLENTRESELIDEIKNNISTVIPKNSTNGFHVPEFQKFLAENRNIKNFIVCGDCTDICVHNDHPAGQSGRYGTCADDIRHGRCRVHRQHGNDRGREVFQPDGPHGGQKRLCCLRYPGSVRYPGAGTCSVLPEHLCAACDNRGGARLFLYEKDTLRAQHACRWRKPRSCGRFRHQRYTV